MVGAVRFELTTLCSQSGLFFYWKLLKSEENNCFRMNGLAVPALGLLKVVGIGGSGSDKIVYSRILYSTNMKRNFDAEQLQLL